MRLIDVDVLINEIKKDTETVIKQDDKAGSFWLGYFAGLVIKQPIIQQHSFHTDVANINVDNTISRQVAIDEVCKMMYECFGADEEELDAIKVTLHELPPVQSEPKEGHWIDKGWSGDWAWQTDGRGNCWRVIVCSECGKSVSVESNYCPHCGVKMKGEKI